MSNSKMTRRALLTSIMALMLCLAMLTGTTFAWFTDQETSANNKIVAGNLDVDLLMYDATEGVEKYVSIAENPETDVLKIFSEDKDGVWEPGKTEIVYLAVKNLGNLALKYNIVVNIKDNGLKNALECAIADGVEYGDLSAVESWSDIESLGAQILDLETVADTRIIAAQNGVLDEVLNNVEGETQYFALAIHMKEEAGNEFKSTADDIKDVSIDVTLVATQIEAESDSFDEKYDKDATYPMVDTVTVTETGAAVVLSTDTVKVTVPGEAAQEGDDYKIEVSNEITETDATTGETTVAFDLTMYKNNEKVSGDTIYEVTKNIGTGLFISEVTHNGTALTKATTGADQTYTYDAATGVLTIYTKSFSPFAVTYNTFKDYVIKLNIAYTQTSYISQSTGADLLPIVAVMPEITGYSVYDGDTRIANAVHFRFSDVKKDTINENSYKVSFVLAVKDENGNDLELKPGMPSTINGKEYLHVYMNLIEVPEGYSVSEVRVNDTSLTKTTNSNPATGEYMLGYEAKDIYFQSMEAGLIEVTLTKTN